MRHVARLLTLPIIAVVVASAGFAIYQFIIPHPVSVVLRWTTKSEFNTAGFNLLRSDSSDGPFKQINATLVPGKDDPAVGGEYVYTDTQVIAGQAYYYKLEEVDKNNVKQIQTEEVDVNGQKETRDRVIRVVAGQ